MVKWRMDTAKIPSVITNLTNRSFELNIGENPLYINYLHAFAIVFLLFLLVLTLARLRRMYVHWSFKGAAGMVTIGFALAFIIEGFLLLSGRTLFTEIIGWDNAPKPLSNALEIGRERLVDVLGVTDEIPESEAINIESTQVINLFSTLDSSEAKKVKDVVCTP